MLDEPHEEFWHVFYSLRYRFNQDDDLSVPYRLLVEHPHMQWFRTGLGLSGDDSSLPANKSVEPSVKKNRRRKRMPKTFFSLTASIPSEEDYRRLRCQYLLLFLQTTDICVPEHLIESLNDACQV
jgi:hypothetical protein